MSREADVGGLTADEHHRRVLAVALGRASGLTYYGALADSAEACAFGHVDRALLKMADVALVATHPDRREDVSQGDAAGLRKALERLPRGPFNVIEARTLTHLETDASAPAAGVPVCSVSKKHTAYAVALMEILNALATPPVVASEVGGLGVETSTLEAWLMMTDADVPDTVLAAAEKIIAVARARPGEPAAGPEEAQALALVRDLCLARPGASWIATVADIERLQIERGLRTDFTNGRDVSFEQERARLAAQPPKPRSPVPPELKIWKWPGYTEWLQMQSPAREEGRALDVVLLEASAALQALIRAGVDIQSRGGNRADKERSWGHAAKRARLSQTALAASTTGARGAG